MDKVKRILICMTVIFTSFLFIGEGRIILLIGNNVHIQIHLNHNQNSGPEIPHQHHNSKSDDHEKWINTNPFEPSCSFEMSSLYSYYLKISTRDYKGLIWQPPRSV